MALWAILALGLLAGAAIPAGAGLALWAEGKPGGLQPSGRSAIIAFGGGVLVAAVALVLVPEGTRALTAPAALAAFAAGGLVFAAIDSRLERGGGRMAQLLAMLTDFLPEAIALGALLASGEPGGALLALLIALQNLPEGFNAFEEARGSRNASPRRLLRRFSALALLGPLMAYLGVTFMAEHPALLGALMLFAAGGILYLTFQDIAPGARVPGTDLPALGAVGGFLLGLAGDLLIG